MEEKVWIRGTIIGYTGNGLPIVRLEDEVQQKRVAVTATFGKGLILDQDNEDRPATWGGGIPIKEPANNPFHQE